VREGGREVVSATNLVGLILSIGFAVFFVIALVFPERF
jgi:hypothetical protein